MELTITNTLPVEEMSVLTLAYLGDSIYDLFTRWEMTSRHPQKTAHDLHCDTIACVNNKAQSAALIAIYDDLSEEERGIYRRGRNAKSQSVPKNANISNYRVATGLEMLLGYLAASGRSERLMEVLFLCRDKGWRT